MKTSRIRPPWQAAVLLGLLILSTAPDDVRARTKTTPHAQAPLEVSLIDQLIPQVGRPAINGLDERRRGPIFNAALQQVSQEGKLPPVVVINRDLSLPATVADEPKVAATDQLVRIYLTQWSQTPLGGPADTEILCRFFVELVRGGRVEKKLGPFFARKRYDVVTAVTPEDRWAQYQAAARLAIEEMAGALKSR